MSGQYVADNSPETSTLSMADVKPVQISPPNGHTIGAKRPTRRKGPVPKLFKNERCKGMDIFTYQKFDLLYSKVVAQIFG